MNTSTGASELLANPHAVSHFNWGWWAARNGRYEEAAHAYQQALTLDIVEPEEAMTNLAALYSDQLGRTDLAAQWLERALEANANYYAAHFNLGHLAEQLGDRAGAVAGFGRAAALRSEDGVPLGRLLEATEALSNDDPRLERLRRLANDGEPDSLFSLAHIEEQLGNYEAAWRRFTEANQADQRERPPWPEDAVRARYQSLLAQPLAPLRGDAGPVFIVGMFRTGSTLLEQMLAGHPISRHWENRISGRDRSDGPVALWRYPGAYLMRNNQPLWPVPLMHT